MDIFYKKINNEELFKSFEDDKLLNMETCQNYIPLYNKFFALNENNYNLINLNNEKNLYLLKKKITENIFLGTIKNENNNLIDKQVFFKLCPLLDPFKYLSGQYDISNNNLLNLPKLNNDNCHSKINDLNNSAYVDSFFTYLTSQLYTRMDFFHGIDFYGSYLGYKNNLHIDIGDDIDMLIDNDFFHKNTNKLFTFINSDHEDIFNEDSRSNKKALIFGDNIENNTILDLQDISLSDTIIPLNEYNKEDLQLQSSESILEKSSSNKHNRTNSTDSAISSRSSNTENSKNSNSDSGSDSDSNSDEEYSDEEYSDDSSNVETIMVNINKFPIQIIALENCHNTFDHLLVENKISHEELASIIVQILMMLIISKNMRR